MSRKTGKYKTTGMAKFARLVSQAKYIAAYDKSQAFDFVRSCLTPALDPATKEMVDNLLHSISKEYSKLGTDSTVGDLGRAKAKEAQFMAKIKELAPDYYETIKGNI